MSVCTPARLARLEAIAQRVNAGGYTSPLVDPKHPDPAYRVQFYLGTHRPHWLTFADVPLFISAHTLNRWKSTGDEYPTRKADTFGCGWWALDSGGFTELRDHGEWRLHADDYGGMVVRFMDEIGVPPMFAAPQDWMCEPVIIKGGTFKGQRFVGTGLDVKTHQEWTVENYCYLAREFYFVPWAPVIQGYTLDDYLRCVEMYRSAGVDLTTQRYVGLGSVCRRESTSEIDLIVSTLHSMGITRLHGFGVKTSGLGRYGRKLKSADSMAWSFVARREQLRLPGCTAHIGDCRNCFRWAMTWRELVLAALRAEEADPGTEQLALDLFGGDPWDELAGLLGLAA